MESWEYRQLYKEHVKDYIRIFTKAGWDLDGDEEIEQIILDFRPLFENGATFHYFDYNNRMLAFSPWRCIWLTVKRKGSRYRK